MGYLVSLLFTFIMAHLAFGDGTYFDGLAAAAQIYYWFWSVIAILIGVLFTYLTYLSNENKGKLGDRKELISKIKFGKLLFSTVNMLTVCWLMLVVGWVYLPAVYFISSLVMLAGMKAIVDKMTK